MKRQKIDLWDNITDYRPPVFHEYEFNFKCHERAEEQAKNSIKGMEIAALNYAREIVGDPGNEYWLERRKLCDAFIMGVEFAKRYLL